ncbi:hypothetical protein RvY_18964 [Ramazzottius varieornatus]|uniref:DDE-1 domain-containing protein n=1 Tax=Ramazzottius varieornatus TaxID=947166 RepID=A0A1D1W7Q3_RAMVA|nr:hypothetical protein RvY_18964 [Ramazzottius varieornatus]
MHVCLTICADDSKFLASIVFKGNKKTGKLSPRFLNKLVIPENVRIFSIHSGWWNSAFDQFWISETFDERHDGGTLIRASSREFRKSDLLENPGIEQVIIPARLTGTYQPLDAGVNFPLESYLRRSYHVWRDDLTAVTKSGYLEKPSRQDFIHFVSEAWDKIKEEIMDSPEDLVASFECSFSSVEDSFTEE